VARNIPLAKVMGATARIDTVDPIHLRERHPQGLSELRVRGIFVAVIHNRRMDADDGDVAMRLEKGVLRGEILAIDFGWDFFKANGTYIGDLLLKVVAKEEMRVVIVVTRSKSSRDPCIHITLDWIDCCS
jgi:hypothetical protein